MIFPNLALWHAHGSDAAHRRIERALQDRQHRLIAGISLSRRLDKLQGVLVLSEGSGRFTRLRHAEFMEAEVPQPLRAQLLGLRSSSPALGDCLQGLSDLAEVQAMLTEKLKLKAGKYVDRVLAVAVCDPGFWTRDFDGKLNYTSMCNPTRLAELSAISVIDNFPARDIAVDGSGKNLEALPAWMLFGDRHERKASQARVLIAMGEDTATYFLPPSDGLDLEVPQIKFSQTLGTRFLDAHNLEFFPPNFQVEQFATLAEQGQTMPALKAAWASIYAQWQSSSSADSSFSAGGESGLVNSLVKATRDECEGQSLSFADLFVSCVDWVGDLIEVAIANYDDYQSIMLSCPVFCEDLLLERLSKQSESIELMRRYGVPANQLDALFAAFLGLLHIDQLPANIPWLTQASSQRILGRLTPGRPSNWRQLLRTMADFQPAPMKLRDAV